MLAFSKACAAATPPAQVWATFSVRRDTLAALRAPLVIAIRLCILLLIPFGVDVILHASGDIAPAHENSISGGGGGGLLAPLATAATHFKALMLLLMPVCW